MVNADATSCSVKGLFDFSLPDDQVFYATHVYSHNHWPDLKQVSYCLVVSGQGILQLTTLWTATSRTKFGKGE